MPLLPSTDYDAVRAIATLTNANPFKPDRGELECRVLGAACADRRPIWPVDASHESPAPNAGRLRDRVEQLAADLYRRLAGGAAATAEELDDYRELVLCLLYLRYESRWYGLLQHGRDEAASARPIDWYDEFAADALSLLSVIPGPGRVQDSELAHLFALGYQVRRAFHYIFRQIFGRSAPATRLRAQAWESLFTHHPKRYRRSLFRPMAEVPLLITGESGTGKDLVARAIAFSQYIPFDPVSKRFAAEAESGLLAVNLAALSPMLIESEMFGHRRGAFTGADRDHQGWFESCGGHGAVFLDEIGDLNVELQVKLLRVLQDRTFQRLGETTSRSFAGKLIAATNRDLAADVRAGRFREDLFFRIRVDAITTPTLRAQLADSPDDLRHLVTAILRRLDPSHEAESLAAEVERYVRGHLAEHQWPGNIRELEQCTRAFLIRGEYRPPQPFDELAAALSRCRLTAKQLLHRYVEMVHRETGSQRETARLLRMHHRTVRAILDECRRGGAGERGAPDGDPGVS